MTYFGENVFKFLPFMQSYYGSIEVWLNWKMNQRWFSRIKKSVATCCSKLQFKIRLARFYARVCLISRSKTNKFCWSLTREGNVLLLLNWCCSKLLRRM